MEPSEIEIRRAVERGVRDGLRSALGVAFWTIASLFAILVGASFVLLGFGASNALGLSFVAAGLFVVGCSVYLLYSLYDGR